MTTREAAAAAFLSPKTVEYHLRYTYRNSGSARERSSRRRCRPPGGRHRSRTLYLRVRSSR
jgi:hypothetical protein